MVLGQTWAQWDKQFLPYVPWIIKRAFLPMLQATNVFACSVPRSKQLFAGISYSVSWFMRETIAPKTLWAKTTYHVDDSGNRRRQDVTREDKKYNEDRHFVRAASLRSRKACQDFTRATLYRNWEEKRPQTKMSPDRRRTLCASLHSRKACQDFTRANLYRNLEGKRPQTKMSPDRRRTLCASLRSQNACQNFTWATLYRNVEEKRPQTKMNPERRRTLCASLRSRKLHVKISQGPIYTEISRKKGRRPKWAQNADEHFVRACAVEKRMSKFHTGHFIQKFRGKNATDQNESRTQTSPLCAVEKRHFIRKFTGKMPRPRVSTLIKHRPLHLP